MQYVYIYVYTGNDAPVNRLDVLKHQTFILDVAEGTTPYNIAHDRHVTVLDFEYFTDDLWVLAVASYGMLLAGWDYKLLAMHGEYLVWRHVQDMEAGDD